MNSASERRDQFLDLLTSCETTLRAFVAAAMARSDERADFFQEVVLVLWRTFDRFDSSRPFLPWAMGIATRRLKEEYRRLQRRPDLLEPGHLDRVAAALVETAASPDREEEALNACLASLPEHTARLIQRRYIDNASIDLLCSETGQTEAALYQTLSRIRRRLGDCIRQRLGFLKPISSASHER